MPRFNVTAAPRAASVCLGLLLLFALTAFAARAGLHSAPPAPAAQEEGDAPPALPLTLRPSGFDEQELTAAPGEYLLVVSNRTGRDGLVLRLDQEDGGRLHEGSLAAHERFWRWRVSLSPGAYVLSAGDDPAWACRITVTPQ